MSCIHPKSFADHFETDETWGLGTMKNSAGTIQWNPHNLLKSSEDFSSSDWAKTGTTVTSNAAMAPDGTLTADEISHTSTSATLSQSITSVIGATYTAGVFAKYIDHQWVRVYLDTAINTWVDIQNVTVGTDTSLGATVTLLSDDWVYIEIPFIAVSTGAGPVIHNSAGDGSALETSGTSAYIWGAHLYRNDLGGMAKVPTSDRALAALEYYAPNKAVVTGPNLVSNGTFDADSDWTKGTGWSIGSGVASCDGTQGANTSIQQSITLASGGVFEVQVTLSNYSAGFGYLYVAGVNATGTLTADGTAKVYVTGTGATTLYFTGNSTFVGDVDDITITQVDRNPSAARYLPRRENHEYINGSWVKGMLVEPDGATNLVTEALDFTDAAWIKNEVGSIAVDAVGPDGDVSAVTLVDSGATGTASVSVRTSHTVSTSTTYTFSVYAKQDQLSWMALGAVGFTTPSNGRVWFDLANGVIGTEDTGLSGTITDEGNGFYRCSVTFTTDAADTSGETYIYVCEGDNVFVNTALDGTSSIIIYGAQLEAGLVPTSYITTSGSAVARGAETTTIPASVMDSLGLFNTVAVDGTELVTNGGFDTDTDWTKSTGWTIGSGVATCSGTSTSLIGAFASVERSVYEVSFDVTAYTSGTLSFTVGGNYAGQKTITSPVAGASYTEMVVGGSSLSRGVEFYGGAFVGSIDNISVKEIHRRAIGVQMHGYMSYGDRDAARTVEFFQWEADASNEIYARLDTRSGDTGQAEFLQISGGTADTASGATDHYSSGTNVPFKIAGRFLDNSLQGAADGVAATENTTPVGLPDLTGVDLEVAYSGPALHITEFNIFAENQPANDGNFKMDESWVKRKSL